jgi:YD repeat-containing protein
MGRVLAATLPDQDKNPANNPVWQYAYDPTGNLTGTTDALGHANTFTYDSVGRSIQRTNGLGHAWGTEHNAAYLFSALSPAYR